MSRGYDERAAEVENLLAAARVVYADRARLAAALASATGLSPEGVELGFESLERAATPTELRAFVDAAGDAAHVHVVLSANVFVAPLRAIAMARAAAARVTVQPSSRDPVLARALVAEARDCAVALSLDRNMPSGADRIDVYGRDETLARLRACTPRDVVVRGHGAGLGVAVVTESATLGEAAAALASDVVPFDQRGCLSPRAVFVVGSRERGEAFADALHRGLEGWARRVPRGVLTDAERAEATRWKETLAFAGHVWEAADHAVAFSANASLALPPSGRHVLVVCVESLLEAAARIESIARFVTVVGTNEPEGLASAVPRHARVAALGTMQRPPLDGPVDRRGSL